MYEPIKEEFISQEENISFRERWEKINYLQKVGLQKECNLKISLKKSHWNNSEI